MRINGYDIYRDETGKLRVVMGAHWINPNLTLKKRQDVIKRDYFCRRELEAELEEEWLIKNI